MNDDELELRLRALNPAAPPPKLTRELLDTVPVVDVEIHWLKYAASLALLAATYALVYILPTYRHRGPPVQTISSAASPSDFRVFIPIERTSTLLEVRDVAVVDRDPHRPVRVVRATWLDDITYAGDDGVSKFRRQEPRSEIIPVSLETF